MNQEIDPTLATLASEPRETHANPGEILAVGTLVADRYVIQALLGQGGMGSVYRAHDRELDELVALKALGGAHGEMESSIERFRREVKLARRVTHPNVARTFDLGSWRFRFLTMELIEGVSLATRIENERLTLSESLRIALEISKGLVAAHGAGVVHRDLKPDNVMLAGAKATGPLNGNERVVITDFGIARAAEDEQPLPEDPTTSSSRRALTMGGIVGTPAYMAPEQVNGETPDGRSDVYALGVLLFEMLTRRLPFDGPSAMAMAMARLIRPPTDLRSLDASIPESVAELVHAMMSAKRVDRPDASHVLHTLERLRGGSEQAGTTRQIQAIARVPGLHTLALDGGDQRLLARNVAVQSLGAGDLALGPMSRELGATIADSLARIHGLRVVPPMMLGANDSVSEIARDHRADLVLSGSVRADGERLRVNLRLIETATGAQKWTERFDGQRDSLFALEDALHRTAESAMRALMTGAMQSRGPTDPAVRALYDSAREKAREVYNPSVIYEAQGLAQRALDLSPGDASVLALMGAILVRVAIANGEDPSLMAKAEDHALRALDADGSLSSTYATLGLVRCHQGDLRASVAAFREALARDPRDAESSAFLGRFLLESGYVEEGIGRLRFAIEQQPATQHAWWNLVRAHAMQGDWEGTDRTLLESQRITGNVVPPYVVAARMAIWRGDPAVGLKVAEQIEASGLPEDSFPMIFLGSLRNMVDRTPNELAMTVLRHTQETSPSISFRAFWCQIIAELCCFEGRGDEALDAIEAALDLSFVDVGWLDQCPLLQDIRDTGRFGRARAIVAARAVALWK
ncbi:MAG: protein kinase [Deltaproteobacteria bacterium]|nr:protein kinase [Deltaproteobacteria bacterium]